ncbi:MULTISPECIES: hypothetical protein [unclassified Azospirillum]|uniref:hypothetical protein n=1 Tax=unclassified Azospirillum TaxID=2630922 RepID=UPI000D6224A6|nr:MULTISPECIES: hypothetical protein [unclassified Azospirillum]PWC63804.1 hypothetical protein TSH20_19305 [Azospirillum sp. TSH20]
MQFILWEPMRNDFGALRVTKFRLYDDAIRHAMEVAAEEVRHAVVISLPDGSLHGIADIQRRYAQMAAEPGERGADRRLTEGKGGGLGDALCLRMPVFCRGGRWLIGVVLQMTATIRSTLASTSRSSSS